MKVLLLGAGNNKTLKLQPSKEEDIELVTLDIDPNSHPDILWDLNVRPLPFNDEEFDQIHAYEVLEHIGQQGDWRGFFDEWNEYYRILKPGGSFLGSCPSHISPWLWGDPGHTRVFLKETATFLCGESYNQIGSTAMTDYRFIYKGNFKLNAFESVDDKGWINGFWLEKV